MKTHWNKISPSLLSAADEETEVWLKKKPYAALISAETKQVRNARHHRLFFALVGKVFENQERFPAKDLLLAYLKIEAGHYDLIALSDGGWARIPRSISWAKMDQGEFDGFFDRICNVVLRDFWPGMEKEALKAEVAEMVGIGGLNAA